jgi:hypothetical protein
MEPIVVATVFGIHSEANQVVSGASSGHCDKLQKLDRPVLTTVCSQQDFGFFVKEDTLPTFVVGRSFTEKDASEHHRINQHGFDISFRTVT